MQKVAFISDVHSNLEALDAVLSKTGGAKLYCLGDIVGYGSDPNAVIERLRAVGAVALLGNHDVAVLSGDTTRFNPEAAQAAEWTAAKLTDNNREYLNKLPIKIDAEFDGVRTFLTHGSPEDNLWEYVEPKTQARVFGRYLRSLDVDLIGLGHTHRSFLWWGKAGFVFNPGSVGQPRDGNPNASFALVTFENGKVNVALSRTEYDVKAAADKILAAGLSPRFAARLFEGT
jgi:putative phosphoesterase